LNQFDQNYDASIIQPIVNDGTVNASMYLTLASYVADLNQYFRTKLLQGALIGKFNMLNLPFDISQMLISCRFMDADCSANDFFQYFDYYYGFCYRFNQGIDLSGNPSNISMVGVAGVKYGLQLELYAGYATGQELYMQTRGFRVTVFNKSAVDHIALEQGIDVATGLNTNIAVIRTTLTHLAKPYGPCLPIDIDKITWTQNVHLKFMYDNYIDGSYFIGLPNPYAPTQATVNWNWTVIYSQFICLKLCYQKYLFEQCGCYDITIPMTPKNMVTYIASACTNGTQIGCLNAREQIFYSNSSLFGACYQNCPLECEQIEYDLKVTTSTYPTEWYGALLAQDSGFNAVVNRYFNSYGKVNITYAGNYTELKNAVAKINVYYDDLSFSQIDESPAMTFDVFLGLVGGNLALFLGIEI
jgi:hypothetical protein